MRGYPSMNLPCPVASCPRLERGKAGRPFSSEIALRFHLAREHTEEERESPATRLALDRIHAAALEQGKRERETRARTMLDRFYRAGCPCRHDAEWHAARRREAGAP